MATAYPVSLREVVDDHGACGEAGPSDWVLLGEYQGQLLAKLCMRPKGHRGRHKWTAWIPEGLPKTGEPLFKAERSV